MNECLLKPSSTSTKPENLVNIDKEVPEITKYGSFRDVNEASSLECLGHATDPQGPHMTIGHHLTHPKIEVIGLTGKTIDLGPIHNFQCYKTRLIGRTQYRQIYGPTPTF